MISFRAILHPLFPLIHSSPKSRSFNGLLLSRLPHRQLHASRDLSSSCTRQQASNYDTSRLLYLLLHCRSAESLKKLHSLVIVNGLTGRENLIAEVIRGYSHWGIPELAISAYQSVKDPTLPLQNLVLRCLSDHELYCDVLTFYATLQQQSFGRCHRSDNFTFPFVIKACAATSAPSLGKQVHCRVLRSGYERNVVVKTALLDMYAKTGDMGASRGVFDGMSHRDLVSWNALLSGYSSNGMNHEALETFQQILLCCLRPNTSTFVSVIPVCSCLGAVETGKTLHGLVYKTGALCMQSLVPTLMSMYALCSDLSAAKNLFDTMSEKDVVAWNSMISGYAQNAKWDDAFEIFQRMHHANVRPTLISLVSILPACGNLPSFRCGELVHVSGIKLGFTNKIPVGTSLLSMYAKLGNLNAAQFLFTAMHEKSLLSWNSMLSACVLNGQFYLALGTIHEMLLDGVMPDSVSMVSVLSACSKLKNLLLGTSTHGFCLRNGLESSQNVMNALMAMYTDCGHFPLSLSLFQLMPEKNLSSWNTLVSASAQVGKSEIAFTLFHQMQRQNVTFDIVTLISILSVVSLVNDLNAGKSFHGHAIKFGYYSDTSLGNALINMYMNCGDLENGYLIFDEMFCKDVVSWNVVMTGFRNHDYDAEVIALFNQMRLCGEKPNTVTLLSIFPMCKSQLIGKAAHGYAVRNFSFLEDSLITSIMCMYSKFENADSCLGLFGTANKRNVVVWNTIMYVFAQNKHGERAVICFQELLRFSLNPDHVTILNLVAACTQLGSSDLVLNVAGYVMKKGFDRIIAISNSLIDMLARCGNILMAKEFFDVMDKRDTISWSAMINAYGLHGNGEAALALFTEMKEAGTKPDGVTCLVALSACSHAGLVEEGRNIFESMEEELHIVPNAEHIACIVDLLSRTGHLEEAYDLVRECPLKPTASMLESLLGACSYHGNTELGERIGNWLLSKSQPNNSRPFVVLSNIHAAAGRWTESCRLRSVMEIQGLRKEPGFSLVTVS